MTSLLPELPASRALHTGDEVVCRTIRCDWDSVRADLAAGGFERVDRLVEMWRAATVLGRVHRVEIEVARVAADAAELRIVPWTARWPRWGSRRQRRYLEVVHAAAGDLQKILSVPVAQRGLGGMIEDMFGPMVERVRRVVRELDPARLSGPDAVRLMEQFGELKRLASAAETLLAARAAETNQWRRDGDRSPEQWLARRTGSSWGEARSTLETAARLKEPMTPTGSATTTTT